MKSQEDIQAKLDGVMADERLHYPPAKIQINAPLALVQLELETKRDVLRWVLADGESKPAPTTGITQLIGDLSNLRTALEEDTEQAEIMLDQIMNELEIVERHQREAANGK